MSTDPLTHSPTDSPTDRSASRLYALGAAVIVAAVFAAYWPVLHGEFVWDDLLVVAKNPLVKGDLTLRTIWFRTDFPLTSVALWLQWLIWGNHPAGYHVINVALHAVNACLVWAVLLRMRIRGAWLAALLFAVHPVCVASAGWISEQKNTLSLLFCLLSLWLFLKADDVDKLDGQHRVPSRLLYPLSILAFVLALLCKTSTVMLPVVLLLYYWWRQPELESQAAPVVNRTPSPPSDGGEGRGEEAHYLPHANLPISQLLRTIPFFVLSLAFGLMTVWFQSHEAFTTAIVQTEGFPGRLAGAGRAVWFYLGKDLWPFHLNLIYPRWQIDARTPLAWTPLALLAVVMAVCWRFREGWGRHALFGLGAFTACLFPALGCFNMYYLVIARVSDHFQYLSLITILALAASILAGIICGLPPVARRILMCVLAFALGILTFQRAHIFATDEGLWRDTLARNPNAWPAHNNLGCILAERQQLNQAAEHFEAALRLYPQNAQTLCNFGRARLLQGRIDEAEKSFRSALTLKPDSVDAHNSLAEILMYKHRLPEAATQLREALRIEPDIDTRLKLGTVLLDSGNSREAVTIFRQVAAVRPDDFQVLNNLAWVLATSADDTVRDGKEAVQFAGKACDLTHYRDPIPLGTLAAAYAEAGRYPDAVSAAQKAIDLATASGNTQIAQLGQQLLALFKTSHPFRQKK